MGKRGSPHENAIHDFLHLCGSGPALRKPRLKRRPKNGMFAKRLTATSSPITHQPWASPQGAYFLSVVVKNKEHTDPPADFMKRFANNKPPVKAFSECVWPTKKGVLDKKTGERGLVFYIAAIKWVSDTEVEVTGGYVEGNSQTPPATPTISRKPTANGRL